MVSPATFLRPSTQQTGDTLVTLLAQVSVQDRAAFAALYQATCMKLYGVTLSILKRKHIAEDVLQDVYIKIWQRAGDFDVSRGSAIAWMVAIARNRALDEARRGSQIVSTEDVACIDDIPDMQPLASDRMERSEEWRQLADCLGSIEDEKRKMVLLAYHHGLSREFLAQKFGHPVATIKTWLRRSLESLKQCLES